MLTGAWILALLFTGAPLLALAGGGGAEADDEDEAGARPEEDMSTEASQNVDDPDGPEDQEDALPPTDYEFILGSGGDHRVEGFRPGTDTLTLTSETWEFDLYDLGNDGSGPAFEIVQKEIRAILRFPGLGTLPVDDVYLHVSEPGAESQRVALRDALFPEEDDALAPTDPDAPDEMPDDPSTGPALAPAHPEAADAPPEDSGSREVLAPTDPDAPEERPRG